MTDTSATDPSSFARPSVRLGLFACSGLAALYLGFLCFSFQTAGAILRNAGYYAVLLTVALWVDALWRLWRDHPTEKWSRRELLVAAGLIALLTGMAVTHETFRSKILFDEYALQATAYNLHHLRENSMAVRGYELQGAFVPLDSYLDKRPILFPFAVSVVHDLSGYRSVNVFALNTALYAVTLGLMYALGRRLNGWRGGLTGVLLLGALPLFAQNATGTGMELLNLCMLLAVTLLVVAWLERPDGRRLSALVLGVVLLAQARYESALYVLPAGLAILLGWRKAGRVVLSWPAIAAPLLLLPVALQQSVISNSPQFWELKQGQTSRFSVEYLGANLAGAWDFFTKAGPGLGSSRLLGALGAVAVVIVAWRLWSVRARWRALSPLPAGLLLMGAGVLAMTVMVMFYYWAAWNDAMASRFALPLHVLLVWLVIAAAAWADRRAPASLVVLAVAAVFVLGESVPKQSYHLYSHLGNDELAWERRFAASRPESPRLVLTNKSTVPWLIEKTPAIFLGRAKLLADRVQEFLQQPDSRDILVLQSSRPTTLEGGFQMMPDEVLPEWFRLELLAERRFGTKLARISRLVAVELPPDFEPLTSPPAEALAATSQPDARP